MSVWVQQWWGKLLPAGSWALKSSQKAKRRWEGVSRLPGWKEVIASASLLDTQAACCDSAQTSTPGYGCLGSETICDEPDLGGRRAPPWRAWLGLAPAGRAPAHLPTALHEAGFWLPKQLALCLFCWLRAGAWVVPEVCAEAEASDAEASDFRMRAPDPIPVWLFITQNTLRLGATRSSG